jgi:cell division protein FtsX
MSQTIQDKLGVYFYIKDSPNQQDQTYSKVIEMKSRLEKLGMKVQYLSKDDAMKSIERKIPSVLDSFQKYGIKNPLPATVYVLFNNSKDYDKLRAVVTLYADIISNREDISKIGESIKKQEARVLHTLGLTHFIVFLSFFLVLVLVIIVCSFLMLVIKTKFDRFRKMLSIQQLLGTPYRLIKIPFMIVI